MASKVKEDEKNERIIRSLLKQTENRRCINCNSLGPQYVCTNFWTFVCTTCSGIHREFTHRVKSVSMAKFSSQEVSSLQEGGNQRAKEIYFKEWDLQRNSFPDSSNIERLRDFIKHVYVDRRFSGGRSYDKPPRGKMGDKEDVYENRRTDGYQGGSRSPPYEDTYERRYSDRSSPGGTSDDRNSRYGYDERQSPARPEIVNDWRREDRFGNGKKFEDSGIVDGDPKLEGRSPERAKDLESSSPPVVRPIREILGESVIPLRISDPPKADSRRTIDGPLAQRTTSSSLGSTCGKPAEVKVEMTGSLIDFDADPGPPVVSAVPQTQQTTVTQSTVQPTSSTNDNNWATFDFASQTNVSQTPPSVNTLESVLSQLSAPASVPGHLSGASSGVGGQIAAPVGNVNVAPLVGNSNVPFTGQIQGSPFGAIAPASSGYQDGVHNAGQWPNMRQQQTSFFSAAGGQSTMQQFMPQGGGATANQQWNFAASQHMQGPLSAPVAQTPQVVSQPPPPPAETKASGRQELPMDLFTATYPSYRAAAPGWQTGPPRGMGFTMQYNTAVPMTAFPQSSRSANPFDLGGEATPLQNQSFPSMASFQGALPMVPRPSMVPTSSLGHPSSAWMPPQSLPYGSGMPPQSLPYGSGMPPQSLPYGSGMLLQSLPNASTVPQRPQYLGAQQLPSNLPPSSHQIGGPGGEASFGFVNTNQQAAGRFSAAGTPQPFSSVGGNPFG